MFAAGGEIAAHSAEDFRGFDRAKAAGYFLLNFGHAKIAFAEIVSKRDPYVGHKAQYFGFVVAESFEKIARLIFLRSPSFGWSDYFRIGALAVGADEQSAIALEVKCRFLFWKTSLRFLDGSVYFFQEPAHIFRPSLTVLFPSASEFTQVVRIAKAMFAVKAEVRLPMIVYRDALEVRQDAHRCHGLGPALFVGEKEGPHFIGSGM